MLGDGILGELAGEYEADRLLDLAAPHRRLLVDLGEHAGLGRDAFEDILHEGVEDRDALLGDAELLVGHLVDVRVVGLISLRFHLHECLHPKQGGAPGGVPPSHESLR